MIKEFLIDSKVSKEVWDLASYIFDKSQDKSQEAILNELRKNQLPQHIAAPLSDLFKAHHCKAIILRDVVVQENLIIPTPHVPRDQRILDFAIETVPLWIMSRMGFPFGYQIQQSGKIINDIYPVKEFENLDNSTKGVNFRFNLHTEDAYHAYPPDFLGLFCVRNKEQAQTLVSMLTLGVDYEKLYPTLFKAQFVNNKNAGSMKGDLLEIERPILFGNYFDPSIQVNSARPPQLPNAQAVVEFNAFIAELDSKAQEIILNSGDMLILNNQKCLHGRAKFTTNFGDEGRWLLRVLSRRDLSRCITEDGNDYVLI